MYGYCPICGAEGISRERCMNGNDTCAAGHKYPSLTAKSTPGKAKPTKDKELATILKELDAQHATHMKQIKKEGEELLDRVNKACEEQMKSLVAVTEENRAWLIEMDANNRKFMEQRCFESNLNNLYTMFLQRLLETTPAAVPTEELCQTAKRGAKTAMLFFETK